MIATLDIGSDRHLYAMPGLHAGEVVYICLEAWCGEVDTTLEVVNSADASISYAFNDDFRQTNSGLAFIVPTDGDYALIVASFAGSSQGEYRLAVGIDTPEILDGAFVENGVDLIAFADLLSPAEVVPVEQSEEIPPRGCPGDEALLQEVPRIRNDDGIADEIIETLAVSSGRNLYVLQGLEAGDVVYAYVERWCSEPMQGQH